MGLMKRLSYEKLLLESLPVEELEKLGYTKEKRKFLRQTIRNFEAPDLQGRLY